MLFGKKFKEGGLVDEKPKFEYPMFIPPPPTQEVRDARRLIHQIEEWQNCGNKLVEMDLWNSLSNRALEQVEKIKQSQKPKN